MLQLWKVRRGRKAAVALIAPFIERSRMSLGGIPDAAWHDPYMMGLLAMLISLEARETGSLESNALGLVQSEALAELSGQAADVIGEAICTLSMEQNSEFGAGCRNAAAFHAALQMQESEFASGNSHTLSWQDYPSGVGPDVDIMWREIFDGRLSYIS